MDNLTAILELTGTASLFIALLGSLLYLLKRRLLAALCINDLAPLRTGLVGTGSAPTTDRERDHLAEEARRELVNFLSHDLRTPLAGLRALTEGLEDGVIDDIPRALGHLRITVDRMSSLVEDMFALTRLHEPREVKQEKMISLAEMIVDVVAELTAVAAVRRVQITANVPISDRLALLGVPDDLTRALMNLASNAVRHTDAGRAVSLVGRRTADGRIRIAVIDECGGIPEEDLPLVFNTGWRGVIAPSRDEGGAGLGLAIARGVIHSHAGQIAVRNVEGGCQFEVDLPSTRLEAVALPLTA